MLFIDIVRFVNNQELVLVEASWALEGDTGIILSWFPIGEIELYAEHRRLCPTFLERRLR